MLKYCSYCDKKFSNLQKLYFSYDHICCSNNCRNELTKIIISKDPHMRNPEQWKNMTKECSSYNLENLANSINKDINSISPNKIKKNKSYKKEICKISDDNYIYDCSYNIIMNTLITLRDYLTLKGIFDISKINLSLVNSMIVLPSSCIFTKLYF